MSEHKNLTRKPSLEVNEWREQRLAKDGGTARTFQKCTCIRTTTKTPELEVREQRGEWTSWLTFWLKTSDLWNLLKPHRNYSNFPFIASVKAEIYCLNPRVLSTGVVLIEIDVNKLVPVPLKREDNYNSNIADVWIICFHVIPRIYVYWWEIYDAFEVKKEMR